MALMHVTLQGMYTDDYDTVHGDMVILRHYVHDDYINIHFKFSNRKFNLVWDMHVIDEGDVYDIWFTGEKIGEDIDLFLNSIAPYVLDESYISFSGEDGSQWRYLFKDKQMLDQTGTVTYD